MVEQLRDRIRPRRQPAHAARTSPPRHHDPHRSRLLHEHDRPGHHHNEHRDHDHTGDPAITTRPRPAPAIRFTVSRQKTTNLAIMQPSGILQHHQGHHQRHHAQPDDLRHRGHRIITPARARQRYTPSDKAQHHQHPLPPDQYDHPHPIGKRHQDTPTSQYHHQRRPVPTARVPSRPYHTRSPTPLATTTIPTGKLTVNGRRHLERDAGHDRQDQRTGPQSPHARRRAGTPAHTRSITRGSS